MVFGFLLPKETSFFDLFDKQADYAVQAAAHFAKMVADYKIDEVAVGIMKEIEHLGDEVSHQIMDRLNNTFITPFDREDIHDLVNMSKATIINHGKKVRITLDMAESLVKEIDEIRTRIGVDRGALIKVWLYEKIVSENCRVQPLTALRDRSAL